MGEDFTIHERQHEFQVIIQQVIRGIMTIYIITIYIIT